MTPLRQALAAEAADRELTQLKQAVLDYLSEFDNPAPDYVHRKTLRDRLRKLTGAPIPAMRAVGRR